MTADLLYGVRAVQRVLMDTRELVGPALRRAVEQLPDPLRPVAGYHFGWLDEYGRPAVSGGGKMIRPALALLSAAAVGGRAEEAVRAAVVVELTHNFSLLHDDVMDGDRSRHHRPTVWAVFGVPAAVLAGDALLALACRTLADSAQPHAGEATRVLTAVVQSLIAGQSADLEFERRDMVSLPECTAVAADKTGALLGGACVLGALAGGGSARQVGLLRGFGAALGMAFQLIDDLLGIWGDPNVTGKPIGSDLASRKKSLPVTAALASGTPAGVELAALYRSNHPLTAVELERAANLVEAAGGRGWAWQETDRHIADALALLRDGELARIPCAELTGLAGLIARRDR